MKKMSKLDYLRAAMFALYRLFQAAVLVPAGAIGVIYFGLVAGGEEPGREVLTAIYRFAEESVRPAAPGHLIVTRCKDDANPQNMKPVCEHLEEAQITAEQGIRGAQKTIGWFWMVAFGVSLVALIATFPGRQFFGLRPALPAPAALPWKIKGFSDEEMRQGVEEFLAKLKAESEK